jgi:hypothetical protein
MAYQLICVLDSVYTSSLDATDVLTGLHLRPHAVADGGYFRKSPTFDGGDFSLLNEGPAAAVIQSTCQL